MRTTAKLVDEIQALVANDLERPVDSPDQDLLTSGIIDSLNVVQLLSLLEERFGISLPAEELDVAQLQTVNTIAALVEQRIGNGAVPDRMAGASA